jgi:putative flippase GtrA
MKRMIRFGLVGVVNTGVYYGLYLVLRTFIPYLVAHFVAFCLAMVGSYFLNCYFTFKVRPTWKKFLLFPLSNVTNLTVTSLGLYLLVDVAGLSDKWAPLPAAAAAIPITFVVAKYVLAGPEDRVKAAAVAPAGE